MRQWMLLGLVAGSALMGKPRVVRTTLPTDDVVVAETVLAAAGAGVDATVAVQEAIDRVADGGGGVVFLRAGRHRIDGRIAVREGVTLRGDWQSPERGVKGTVLLLFAGRGEPDSATIIELERGSGLREMTLWFPEQYPDAVVPYPWTVGTSARMGGNNVTLRNVTLINPYRGVRVGPHGNELHTLRNVYMTPLRAGVFVDSTTDIGRMIDVRIGPEIWESCGLENAPTSAEDRAALRKHMQSGVTGLDFGRSDWEYIYRVFVQGVRRGIVFRKGVRGATNAVMVACEIRDCEIALELNELNGVGLAATSCIFQGLAHGLAATKAFTTVSQFHSCRFGGGVQAVTLAEQGVLTFQNCVFTGAVAARGGQLSLVQSRFRSAAPHVLLGPGVDRVRVLGCTDGNGGEATAQRETAELADVVVSPLPADFPRSIVPRAHVPAPARRPRGDRMHVVTDSGASPDLKDNTVPFQLALDAVRKTGGTVYVPAGMYRFAGSITVPAGVELRGCFDVPHHTVSGGTVLLPTGGAGDENAVPFIQLEGGAGARGLTIWYPEQNLAKPFAYPWTIRSLGPQCWLTDVTIGNAWWGVDFWSHDSTGHVISYLAGGFLRKGLFVSKCDGDGWVEDVQFNPHYALRLHASLPRLHEGFPRGVPGILIDYQREHLEGIVFGRCADEHVRGTFLYAAYDGVALRDDDGGCNATILMHGSDTASRAVVLERVGDAGALFVNAQLVPLGKWVVGGVVSTPEFRGEASFLNTQMWAPGLTAVLEGRGKVTMQQMNSLSGGLHVKAGELSLTNVLFGTRETSHVEVSGSTRLVRSLGCLDRSGPLRVEGLAGTRTAFANSASLAPILPPESGSEVIVSFESDQGKIPENIVAYGGGKRSMETCSGRVVKRKDAHGGEHAFLVEGQTKEGHAFVYYQFASGPVGIFPDSVLTYWMKPLNDSGRNAAVDLVFDRGRPLRDTGTPRSDGGSCHPCTPKGKVGEWTQVEIPLARHGGKLVTCMMAARDARGPATDFAVLFDDVSIQSTFAKTPWRVKSEQVDGNLVLTTLGTTSIRWTSDGSNPNGNSTLYTQPIPLGNTPVEYRFSAQGGDSTASPFVFSRVCRRKR
ncbi:MAG: chitobiase/beta-hexosaminidase C-terminal domain-containing protein [Lentisphaeria bacterium]|nr:chitobiase/beta-hexosaminidase C-terminal domain-containing protein [Lentisphaeria bacterium]